MNAELKPTEPTAPQAPFGAPESAVTSFRKKKQLKKLVAAWSRWLHVYVSMFGLLSVLFFSVTGITLNHPDWFFDGAQSLRHESGEMDAAWLAVDGGEEAVARLEIVESLRAAHGIRGAVTEFSVDDYECAVTFKGPGYSADAFIDRETGAYNLTESYAGLVAVMNDLHKGRDSGAGWAWLIDISATVLTLASGSGLLLMCFVKKRRRAGLVTAGIGAVLMVLVYIVFVP